MRLSLSWSGAPITRISIAVFLLVITGCSIRAPTPVVLFSSTSTTATILPPTFLLRPQIATTEIAAFIDPSQPEGYEIVSSPQLMVTDDSRSATIAEYYGDGAGFHNRFWRLTWQSGKGVKVFVKLPAQVVRDLSSKGTVSIVVGNPNQKPVTLALAAIVSPKDAYMEGRPLAIPGNSRSIPLTFSTKTSDFKSAESQWQYNCKISNPKESYLVLSVSEEGGSLLFDQIGGNITSRQIEFINGDNAPKNSCPRWAASSGIDLYGRWADLTIGTVTQRMRWIPPGRDISVGYWIADTECTQGFWAAGNKQQAPPVNAREMPSNSTSWYAMNDFCRKISNYDLGLVAHLPRHDEWLHAALADASGFQNAGDGDAMDMGWFIENAKDVLQPVARKSPNTWGLFDVHGNVAEWTTSQRGTGNQYWCYGGKVNTSANAGLHSRWSAAGGNRYWRRGFRFIIDDEHTFTYGNQIFDMKTWREVNHVNIFKMSDKTLEAPKPFGTEVVLERCGLIPSHATISLKFKDLKGTEGSGVTFELIDTNKISCKFFVNHIKKVYGISTFIDEVSESIPEGISSDEHILMFVTRPDQVSLQLDNKKPIVIVSPLKSPESYCRPPFQLRILTPSHSPIVISNLRISATEN